MLSTSGPLVDLSPEQIKYTFDTNTFAALRMAKTVIPFMAQKKSGLLVNIGSITGEVQVYVNLQRVWEYLLTGGNSSGPLPGTVSTLYSASNVALHTITEVLQMECRPFNINVMLVSPRAIKSEIANNQNAHFKLPYDPLYGDFVDNMIQRMGASQGANSMPTVAFAKLVVKKSLQTKTPSYITAGESSTAFHILKWLPRALVLWLMWRRFSEPAK